MSRLRKSLTLLDVWGITLGAVISSGIFVLPGIAYAQAGSSALLSYLLAGCFATTGLLSQAELATAMPKAGGTYFYINRSMGAATGTVYGLVTLLALALKSSFELIGMAACIQYFYPVGLQLPALFLAFVFICLNLTGVKAAGRLQAILTSLVVIVLLLFVWQGFSEINIKRLSPSLPLDGAGIFRTAGMVFLSFGGLLKVASLAEEVQDPGRDLPYGMFLSMGCLLLLYMLVITVTFALLDPEKISGNLTPLTTAAASLSAKWVAPLCWVAAIMAFSSAANTGIMGASRYPLALARDRLLPRFFGVIHPKTGVPVAGIVVTGIFMALSLLLSPALLVKAASCILILTYIFTCLAVIILRESRLQNYRPRFVAPFYPWLQIIGIMGFVFMLSALGATALLLTTGLAAAGLFLYFQYGRKHASQEHALLHLIARITDRRLISRDLEAELRTIVCERDAIIKDRFDEIVERTPVIDIAQPVGQVSFFRMVTENMAPSLGVDKDVLFRLMMTREAESSTVLSPHVAIPHIILEGEKRFHLLIARCKDGIRFSDTTPDVKAVFVLMGSKDERNFHLRALAAIAQVIRDDHFEEDWLAAKDAESLRDLLLLGCRRR